MIDCKPEVASTAIYLQVSTLLLRIGGPLFHAWSKTGEVDAKDRYFHAWKVIRHCMADVIDRRSTILPPAERGDVTVALRIAHMLAHGGDPDSTPDLDRCRCSVAGQICDLDAMLIECATAEC